jgi:hypothetical protein
MFKKCILSLLLAIVSVPLFAAENEIILRITTGHESGSRTSGSVYASIDEQVITVSFSDVVSSSIVVYDTTESENLLYSRTFEPDSRVQADLTTLDTGEYIIEIYAYGYWWIGYFEID